MFLRDKSELDKLLLAKLSDESVSTEHKLLILKVYSSVYEAIIRLSLTAIGGMSEKDKDHLLAHNVTMAYDNIKANDHVQMTNEISFSIKNHCPDCTKVFNRYKYRLI